MGKTSEKLARLMQAATLAPAGLTPEEWNELLKLAPVKDKSRVMRLLAKSEKHKRRG